MNEGDECEKLLGEVYQVCKILLGKKISDFIIELKKKPRKPKARQKTLGEVFHHFLKEITV